MASHLSAAHGASADMHLLSSLNFAAHHPLNPPSELHLPGTAATAADIADMTPLTDSHAAAVDSPPSASGLRPLARELEAVQERRTEATRSRPHKSHSPHAAVKLAFDPPQQHLQGVHGRVLVTLTYSEQSCFAYNQGGSTKARESGSGRGRRGAAAAATAPKYIKIPQVTFEQAPQELTHVRVGLRVLEHFDRTVRQDLRERQSIEFTLAALETDNRRWVLPQDDHLGASRCVWLFAFLDSEGQVLDELETPPFLLNCNRTQQRYTNAMMAAERFLEAGGPISQTILSREDATRLLALYRRTSENTMYIFDDKLKRLKAMLPLAELMALETRLPRLRAIRQQERVEAMNEAGEGHGPRAKRRRTQRRINYSEEELEDNEEGYTDEYVNEQAAAAAAAVAAAAAAIGPDSHSQSHIALPHHMDQSGHTMDFDLQGWLNMQLSRSIAERAEAQRHASPTAHVGGPLSVNTGASATASPLVSGGVPAPLSSPALVPSLPGSALGYSADRGLSALMHSYPSPSAMGYNPMVVTPAARSDHGGSLSPHSFLHHLHSHSTPAEATPSRNYELAASAAMYAAVSSGGSAHGISDADFIHFLHSGTIHHRDR